MNQKRTIQALLGWRQSAIVPCAVLAIAGCGGKAFTAAAAASDAGAGAGDAASGPSDASGPGSIDAGAGTDAASEPTAADPCSSALFCDTFETYAGVTTINSGALQLMPTAKIWSSVSR